MYHGEVLHLLEVPAFHQQLAMVFFIQEKEISTVFMAALVKLQILIFIVQSLVAWIIGHLEAAVLHTISQHFTKVFLRWVRHLAAGFLHSVVTGMYQQLLA